MRFGKASLYARAQSQRVLTCTQMYPLKHAQADSSTGARAHPQTHAPTNAHLNTHTQLNGLGRATERVWFEMEYIKKKQMFKPTAKTLTIVAMVKHQPLDTQSALSPKPPARGQSQKLPTPQSQLPAYAQSMWGPTCTFAQSRKTCLLFLGAAGTHTRARA